MKTATAKVSTRYQVVLPKTVRVALGIQPDDTILFLIDEDRVIIRPRPRQFTAALRGLHRHVWQGSGKSWLARERASWQQTDSDA